MKKLGKKPVRHDPRTLRLAQYTPALPQPPAVCDHLSTLSNLGDMQNNEIGDCTCAAVGHMVQAWTAADGLQEIVPDAAVVGMYSAVSGYVPGKAETDNGAVVLDVLNYWRKTGLDEHVLGAYVAIDLKNHKQLMQSVWYFGGTYLGMDMPLSAQNQKVWSVPPDGPLGNGRPGTWGGHAVPIVAYNNIGPVCISWGEIIQLTWGFYDVYCEEAYTCFSSDIVGSDDKSPEGFNSTQLLVDLTKIVS